MLSFHFFHMFYSGLLDRFNCLIASVSVYIGRREVINHQFNWWFDYAPIRGLCLQRLKGGCLKHLYRLASKRGYLLVSSLFDSSFCC